MIHGYCVKVDNILSAIAHIDQPQDPNAQASYAHTQSQIILTNPDSLSCSTVIYKSYQVQQNHKLALPTPLFSIYIEWLTRQQFLYFHCPYIQQTTFQLT